VEVPANSPEWVRVLNRIRETMPQAVIVKLERVQNQHLWERYYRERARVARKNDGNPNEIGSLSFFVCFFLFA
jgi:hypothetical protein